MVRLSVPAGLRRELHDALGPVLDPLLSALSHLRAAMSTSTPLFALVALALLVTTVASLRWVWAAVALIPLAGLWLVGNERVHGPTLLALSWNHGITVGDLPALGALVVAGWRLLQPLLASSPD